MLNKILVATDGSEHAHKAVVFAADLALKYKAKLTLLHVPAHGVPKAELMERLTKFDPAIAELKATPGMTVGAAHISGGLSAEGRELVGKTVLEEARLTAESKGCKGVETLLQEGEPAETILAQAKAQGADLIVLGSRGLGNLKGLLMGSVSHQVSHLADRTCITVR